MGSWSAARTWSPGVVGPEAEAGWHAGGECEGTEGAARPRQARPAAPDRFRQRSGDVLAIALILSVIVHFAFFRLFRGFGIPELDAAGAAIGAVELPPELEIPSPPEAIARPATPTVATVEVSEDLTIAPTTFEANPAASLGPPPPAAGATDPSERPRFIPYDTPPRLQNGDEIRRLLAREYPKALREAGIGGTVLVWLYVDLSGTVARTLVKETSGSTLLDAAAERIAGRMRFVPARNRDKPTAVWVSQPISFELR